MILESKVLKKMRMGKQVLCTKTSFSDPDIIEVIGTIGFDCMWICREHLWANDETLNCMIKAARGTGMDTVVRIAKSDYVSAIKPLEMGAKGIMVPHVKTAEDAKFWVENTKFYPDGRRSVDGVNADTGWMSMELKKYLKFANRETFIAAQIEDSESLPNIEKIAETPNLDMIFVGPLDLSMSMGFEGDTNRKEIWDILERVGKIANKYGKFAGAPCGSKKVTKRLLDMGYLFILNGFDLIFLRNSFLKLREEYKELGFTFQ